MDEIPLTEIQSKLSEMILATPAPSQHSARSAISHIGKAWKLRRIDPEMAVFRAITGEEESVTTIFHSLKRLKYLGSDRLNPRSHVHKSALHPFLLAIENNFYLANMSNQEPTIELDLNEQPPTLKTRLTFQNNAGEDFFVYPIPPLNFTVKQNGMIYNFESELLQITNKQTLDKVVDHIRTLANRRNQLLYASQTGFPEVRDLQDDFFFKKRDTLFRNLILYLLIDPFPIQLFVQQALDAFLAMLGLLPKELESENSLAQPAHNSKNNDSEK